MLGCLGVGVGSFGSRFSVVGGVGVVVGGRRGFFVGRGGGFVFLGTGLLGSEVVELLGEEGHLLSDEVHGWYDEEDEEGKKESEKLVREEETTRDENATRTKKTLTLVITVPLFLLTLALVDGLLLDRHSSPLLVPDVLQSLSSGGDGSSGRVEEVAVLEHKLDVRVNLLRIVVVVVVEVLSNGGEVHGSLDDLGVVGDVESDGIWKSFEGGEKRQSQRTNTSRSREDGEREKRVGVETHRQGT